MRGKKVSANTYYNFFIQAHIAFTLKKYFFNLCLFFSDVFAAEDLSHIFTYEATVYISSQVSRRERK